MFDISFPTIKAQSNAFITKFDMFSVLIERLRRIITDQQRTEKFCRSLIAVF